MPISSGSPPSWSPGSRRSEADEPSPERCGGRPCIRGMRIRVGDVLELLAAGETPEQILEEHPSLEPEDISACLQYAARRLSHPVLAA